MAGDIYKRCNENIAKGEVEVVRQHIGDKLILDLRNEKSKRKFISTADYIWESKGLSQKLVNLVQLDIPLIESTFLQATIRFDSYQTFVVNSKKTGELLAGSTTPRRVIEYWVFERKMEEPKSNWIVVSRLTRPEKYVKVNPGDKIQ